MLKDRSTKSPYLLREIPADESFVPKVGDIAFLETEENDIQLQVVLKNKEKNNWTGEILSYRPGIKEKTLEDRHEKYKKIENFLNANALTNGFEIDFLEIKIHGLSR